MQNEARNPCCQLGALKVLDTPPVTRHLFDVAVIREYLAYGVVSDVEGDPMQLHPELVPYWVHDEAGASFPSERPAFQPFFLRIVRAKISEQNVGHLAGPYATNFLYHLGLFQRLSEVVNSGRPVTSQCRTTTRVIATIILWQRKKTVHHGRHRPLSQ